MKKIIFTVLVITIFYSCKNESSIKIENNYILNFNMRGIESKTKVFLKRQENNIPIKIDSTITSNGKFEFKGNIQTPAIYGVFLEGLKDGIFPIIEKGTINISAHKDSLYNVVISGSKLNDQLNIYKNGSKKIVEKINDLFPEFQKARSENNIEKLELLNTKMKAINDKNTNYSLNYAKNNPDSYVSSIILESLLRIPTIHKDTISTIYNSFSEEVKKSNFSKSIAEFLGQKD